VALAEVISHPKQYDGRRVRVVGFCSLEFEGNALYLQGADYYHQMWKHAVWLDVEDLERSRDLSAFNNRYVQVEGTYDAKQLGHLSLFAGTLTSITSLQPAEVN
jgi:hypothetical protein